MEIKTDLNRKWKYLQFFRDDGFQGWSLGLSDEPSEVPCDKLLSITEINSAVERDKTFGLVFDVIASDPQLIECADGLHEAVVLLASASSKVPRWKFFPV